MLPLSGDTQFYDFAKLHSRALRSFSENVNMDGDQVAATDGT